MELKEIGWTSDYPGKDIDSLARITCVHRGWCQAVTTSGDINVYLTGRFHFDQISGADKPATGDFVEISAFFVDKHNARAATLKKIITRRSKISRMAARDGRTEQVLVANVDFVFIVTSANDDFNINRLQRYILLAKEGNVTPIIILSKIDLVKDDKLLLSEIESRFGEIQTIPVSSLSNVGLDKVREKLVVGTTSAFLGSSGVGKSTIVNKILGEEIQTTKEIRESDSKGHHATTGRELFFIPHGGMIIDTAGLREIQVLAGEDSVASTFEAIAKLIQQCRYSDCKHETEPACAILNALENRSLAKEEYDNYLKLQKEAAFAENKLSKSKASNAKKRWKTINKNYKARQKHEDRD